MVAIMKSIDIKNMKKIDSKNKKRVLLLNPKRKDLPYSLPHNGLATLAAILKKRGHEVLVVDYLFLRSDAKNISYFMDSFKPDIIGLTMYAPVFHEANNLIDKIRAIDSRIPIMVGGAFPTLYSDMLDKNSKIDYIFIGEAELTIIGTVESAKRQKLPKIITTKDIVNIDYIPHPDYTSFYNYKTITGYPMMTSRGCPYRCSFCSSVDLCYRKWRMKSPENCIEEIQLAKKAISPGIVIHIYDDNPNVDKKRFNQFLELFHKKIGGSLTVTHTRADSIDDEFLILLKKCGVRSTMIGVEHGNKEVYNLINKGETLEQIENACRLIKKHGLGLGLSFVVGLPLDNLERTKESIAFFNKVGAEGATVNPIIPYRGTAVRRWFESHGAKLYDEIGKVTGISNDLDYREVFVETSDFTKEQRKKAYYMFLFGIGHDFLQLKKLPKIILIAIKYNLYLDFLRWLPKGIKTSYRINKTNFLIAMNVLKKQGLKELIRRIRVRNK